jgi:hypothetical protein
LIVKESKQASLHERSFELVDDLLHVLSQLQGNVLKLGEAAKWNKTSSDFQTLSQMSLLATFKNVDDLLWNTNK